MVLCLYCHFDIYIFKDTFVALDREHYPILGNGGSMITANEGENRE